MLLFVLVLIVAILLALLIYREPELRRWIATVLLRREGTVRAALGRFQPRDLQRQALALVKEKALVSIGFAHLPSDVTVVLNPEDLDRLGAARDHVARELTDQIAELDGSSAGGDVVFLLAARPQVKFESDAQVQVGTVAIVPAWLEGTVPLTALLPDDDRGPVSRGPRLRIEIDGGDSCDVFLAGRMTVGRAPSSDIPINHPGVSREHAVLTVDGPLEVTITDLESVNGIELGGTGRIRPNTPVRIPVGEAIQLGRHVRIELVADETEVMSTSGGA